MRYITYNDISATLRRNLHRLPPLSMVVGVPRSGMIPAIMLSELLNIPCSTLDDFVAGRATSCGARGAFMKKNEEGSVLILDDTVFYGNSIQRVRASTHHLTGKFRIIYGCVYAEGKEAAQKVDFCFEDIYNPKEKLNLYEWNILHHYPVITEASMWDIDGLLCKNPPDDHNTAAYEAYLPNAIPLIIPTTCIGAFVTYRLEKYRAVTEQWLQRHRIEYGQLIMFNATNRHARDTTCSPALYKSIRYTEASWAQIFFESDPHQAEQIHQLSSKPVFCFETAQMFS